ncbi:MAG: hypothetical protein ACSLFR_00470 [Solirubrobacteraceae bacterium]
MSRVLMTFAQYRMDNDHMDGGWEWVMFALMVLTLVAVVGLVVWLARSGSLQRSTATAETPETPGQILDRRLATGELTPAEFEERRRLLDGA